MSAALIDALIRKLLASLLCSGGALAIVAPPHKRKKSLPGATTALGRLFLFGVAGLVAVVTGQSTLDVHLVTQRSYFGVSLFKSASDFCDQSDAFCKTFVEG